MSGLHFNGFGVNQIVLGVRADEFHVNSLEAIGHRHHQSIVIALDVEHDPAILQNAGTTVLRLDVRRLAPVRLLHLIHPRLQGLLGVRIGFPERSQVADGNDSHAKV